MRLRSQRRFFNSPTKAQGKREVDTVYAKTKEECNALLEKMVVEVRERIKGERGDESGKLRLKD